MRPFLAASFTRLPPPHHHEDKHEYRLVPHLSFVLFDKQVLLLMKRKFSTYFNYFQNFQTIEKLIIK